MTAHIHHLDSSVVEEALPEEATTTLRPARRETVDAPQLGVVLGADSLMGRRSGIGRVAIEIAQRLGQRAEVGGYCFLTRGRLCPPRAINHLPAGVGLAPAQNTPPRRSATNQKIRLQLGRVGVVRKLYEMKLRMAMNQEVDAFRGSMAGRLVYYEPNFIPFPFDGVTVAEINDLSWRHYPDCHPAERIAWIERNLERTFGQTQRFVAISKFTADSMTADFGIGRDRIDVVPLAPSSIFAPIAEDAAAPVLKQYGLEDGRFILSVSTLEPRKNFDRLLNAHRALPQTIRAAFPLVIAGGVGWGDVLNSSAADSAVRDGSLRLLGHVADEELASLMARCTAFAYVSLYEGFGLPVVEAMAAGAPVIASKTTAVGETAGNAALLVDPLDEDEICDAMRRIIEDDGTRRRFAQAGLTHAANFSWDSTMTQLIASWRRALAAA